MHHKIWHKPLHKRKIWKQMSLMSKIIYYMQPFLEHVLDTWMQPLPFPTILKFLYSCVVTVFILLPVIYPSVVILFSYGTTQFLLQRHGNLHFPASIDLLRYLKRVHDFKITNEKYNLFIYLYLERWRMLGTAIASSIDYIRLTLCMLFGLFHYGT